mmetsp:Transcript_10414/g.38671  ORF Transcript_10414/g.38671 Transcript_10414/m.38671 type:complete len:207 (+) Transcript_10414:1097-1717(+)
MLSCCQCTESKICNLQVVLVIHEKIFRLQIAMSHSLSMTVAYSHNELLKETSCSALGKTLCCHDFVEQFASSDELQNDINVSIRLQYLLELHHILVPNHFHDGNFPPELIFHALSSYVFEAHDFHGIGGVCSSVKGNFDFAILSNTKCFSQLVRSYLAHSVRDELKTEICEKRKRDKCLKAINQQEFDTAMVKEKGNGNEVHQMSG